MGLSSAFLVYYYSTKEICALLGYYIVIFPDRIYHRSVICTNDVSKTIIQNIEMRSAGVYGDNINYRTISTINADVLTIHRRYEFMGRFVHNNIDLHVFRKG